MNVINRPVLHPADELDSYSIEILRKGLTTLQRILVNRLPAIELR